MKATYEKLGIPEAERKYLAGVTAQYESEVVYHRNREDLEQQGILFCDMDTALREYPDLVKQYFGTVIPPGDNKFSALNSAVWTRWLVHLRAAGRRVRDAAAGLLPHQHRERRPVRAHADHRRRGLARCTTSRAARRRSTPTTRCTRPSSRSSSSPAPGSPTPPSRTGRPNVYNLVTKRARVEAEGHMEWIDGNIGSKLTMKYPSVYLVGPKATGEVLSRRLRRPRPAPGRRGQDGARRPGDHLEDRVEVHQQGRRHHHLPRPGAGRRGRLRLQEPRAVRRAHPRRAVREPHPAVHGGRRARRRRSVTRPRSRRSPTSSSST